MMKEGEVSCFTRKRILSINTNQFASIMTSN